MAFSLLSVSLRCLVAYLARLIDPRCTQPVPDWNAGVDQFSLLFFLWLLRTKEEQRSARNCTRSWNWSANQEKALHFCFWISHCMVAVGALETWTWWPHLANFRWNFWLLCLAEVILFLESDSIWSHWRRERERKGRGSEIEQNLLLAWTSLLLVCPTICMQRREKRDANVSWKTSQRRATNRTVAYRPAVSIRFGRSLGFPTCLFLASPLTGAQWRQERSNFPPCFSLLEPHSLFTKSF